MAIRADHRTVNRRVLAVVAGVIILGGGLLWLFLAVLRPEPPTTPSAIDLSGWKLTLPEEGESGNAEEVEPAAVTDPWLTAGPDGSLTFWAPAAGATTKNSKSPRTELISLNDFSAGTDGEHTLSASLAVSQVPADSEEIIIGQIHGSGDIKSVPYVMLHYKDGNIEAEVKQKQKGDEKQTVPLLSGVPLNERFDFTITDTGDGSMTFSASYGGNTQQATSQVPEAFRGEPVRFQVGDYQQAESAQGDDDGGRVTFYTIEQS
ncbi:alginate lyase [Pseudonocardia hierapolitana]|uniref:Alginate lyase n=1 Tax=Pseudonocardia hierapolitana TaxID=1128676 RepID=A0A561SXA7_9PSEU|nr:polysaccharide lyase family 7 protein [Pseudonocardia hierapolitana]TWF79500.1 alginate lyase [Pseudonocardia hierapolitana]